ncbi:MAG: FAD-dependent oxidoreductase [Christensenellaceae bacterium]|jgi:thioredoxin reductase (NADPH)|nr:FAD-dependent oxidoreductase [Christensenellaceae bacterium]
MNSFDLLILGAGPAGFSAAIYAKRAGLNVGIIEKSVPGGAVAITQEVCNYPGIKSIGGMELAAQMFEHMTSLGVEIIFDEVVSTDFSGKEKFIKCLKGEYTAKTVLIAIGAAARKLNLNNERDYLGRGLSYCATCDGTLFKGKTVAVVGGGNSALEDAVYMSGLADKVYLIHRRGEFRGDDILEKTVRANQNVELMLYSRISALEGKPNLKQIELENIQDGTTKKLNTEGVFVAIGRGPDTEVIDKNVAKNEAGYIIADEKMRTNIEGVYVAGDIRDTPLRQIVTATADGAIAATSAFGFIKSGKFR